MSGEARGAAAGSGRLAGPAAPAACTSVETRVKGTLIQDLVAVPSAVTRGTGAGVVVDSVLAGASVEAGVPCTFIDVDFTTLAGKSCAAAAHAHPTVDQTESTCSRGGGQSLSTSGLSV